LAGSGLAGVCATGGVVLPGNGFGTGGVCTNDATLRATMAGQGMSAMAAIIELVAME